MPWRVEQDAVETGLAACVQDFPADKERRTPVAERFAAVGRDVQTSTSFATMGDLRVFLGTRGLARGAHQLLVRALR